MKTLIAAILIAYTMHSNSHGAESLSAIFNPGARILFRSASVEPTFLDNVRLRDSIGAPNIRLTERLRFDRDLADALHQRDRVHTYASFHIADLVH